MDDKFYEEDEMITLPKTVWLDLLNKAAALSILKEMQIERADEY